MFTFCISTANWKGEEYLTNESKTILTSMGSTIEVLDFEDVGDLAGKLSDDDTAAVLVCIDAKRKLKQLLLTGCNMLVGHGLDCLRESIVLEHIGLHLPMESLSWELITSTLDSIVHSDKNSLRVIQVSNIKHVKNFLKNHYWQTKNDVAACKFLKKFMNLLLEGEKCEKCVSMREDRNIEEHQVNTASMTCFECFRFTCDDCEQNTHYSYEIRACSHCGLSFCREHDDWEECYDCHKFHCSICADIDIVGATRRCGNDRCHYGFCLDCIDDTRCHECLGMHFSALKARTSKEINVLNGEITQLRSNNGDLEEENEELRREIEELRNKMSSGLGILS